MLRGDSPAGTCPSPAPGSLSGPSTQKSSRHGHRHEARKQPRLLPHFLGLYYLAGWGRSGGPQSVISW